MSPVVDDDLPRERVDLAPRAVTLEELEPGRGRLEEERHQVDVLVRGRADAGGVRVVRDRR